MSVLQSHINVPQSSLSLLKLIISILIPNPHNPFYDYNIITLLIISSRVNISILI